MENKKSKKSIAAGSLIAGAFISLGAANVNAETLFNYENLGSGSEIRSHIMANPINSSVIDLPCGSKDSKDSKDAKAKDGKCGEGKCGDKKDGKAKDGKCGEGKCGDKKGTKAKDGKCGEGKCGDKKDGKAKEGDKKAADPKSPK